MHRECTALTLWEWGQKILTLIFLLFAWPFLFAAVLLVLFFNATNFISHRWMLRHMAKFIVKLGDCGVPYEVLSGEKEPYPMDLPC